MSTTQLVAIIVVVAGLLIIGATVVSALRSGSAPFGLTAGKEGVKVETTFIGASLLAGLVIFLGAGYFFINNYEKQVGDLSRKNDFLNEIIEKTRGVDLNARLQFSDANAAREAKEAQIVINRDAGIVVVTYEVKDGFLPNERSVSIPGLRSGDEIAIHVGNGVKKYRNKQSIRIPNSLIEMVPE